eukprot:CAMPEP_0117793888 /NCGR_PEP_ID=MMETSP0948-20121206/10354_1 /TAXON_ID=44440 /ORGANISM="Chattonella subsalsa, Strain CCMP2191" /LENGTH=165 /DNA_ID=CAMNT_0005624485 /DNA_START=16 /DNA_END=514 /DNA_ORIENTATION=-
MKLSMLCVLLLALIATASAFMLPQNFDPFKRDKTGNACDASGYYPGDKNGMMQQNRMYSLCTIQASLGLKLILTHSNAIKLVMLAMPVDITQEKEWNDAAKQDVLSMYDPSQPWSETNFDPFKRDKTGNACDASGYYPGDKNYKDPIRPQMSFEEYMKSRQQGGN